MTVEVEMHAFAEGAIRTVTVDEDILAVEQWLHGKKKVFTDPDVLGMIFQYGQNDFACAEDLAQALPSVSVGDIIRYDNKRWAVMPVGFAEVSADFTPPHDGGMWAYRHDHLLPVT